MTKKHYIIIAKIFKKRLALINNNDIKFEIEFIADKLADEFSKDNPKFNKDTFLKTCGL